MSPLSCEELTTRGKGYMHTRAFSAEIVSISQPVSTASRPVLTIQL